MKVCTAETKERKLLKYKDLEAGDVFSFSNKGCRLIKMTSRQALRVGFLDENNRNVLVMVDPNAPIIFFPKACLINVSEGDGIHTK